MAGPNVVSVAAIAEAEVHVTVRAERNSAAIVIGGVLAERDHLAPRSRIYHIGVGGGDFPLVDDVFVIVRRAVWTGISRHRCHGNLLAVVGVQRAIAGAGWVG